MGLDRPLRGHYERAMSSATLVWFRQDLRLHDHEPLTQALADGGAVVGIYCLDPREFAETHVGGFARTGAHRARFLLESLHDLRSGMRARGGDLVVRRGPPEEVLPALAREVGASQVRAYAAVTSDERRVEHGVAQGLNGSGARLETHWGHTLVHRDDLPFGIAEVPELFTAFRVQVERHGAIREPLPSPARLPRLPPGLAPGDIPELEELGRAEPPQDARQVQQWRGGEQQALQRLEQWAFDADALGTYKETRNGMLRADDSSKLSPWLALGCLSPRAVYAAVRRYERERVENASTYWMLFELYWRDYFRFVGAKHGDALFRIGGLRGARIAWSSDRAALDAWRLGQTGYPLVDASMRELLATGFTSNRARQNVASFLTKNLGIDWRLGAAWFESQLIDYDVTSNWGNWAYAAGVGNDARGFRFFNLHKQASDYDPNGDFVRHWLPELTALPAARIHQPELVSAGEMARLGIELGRDYPRPMVPFRESMRACERSYHAGLR